MRRITTLVPFYSQRRTFSRLSEFYCTCGHRSAICKNGPLRKLWNPKVHHRILDIPPFVTILSQENPVHNLSSYLFENYNNVIPPFTPRSSMWSISLRLLVRLYVYGSVHHSTIHKEKSNKIPQCIKIILFHIYMKLNMFRATHRLSSGA
jgi:hypothetical protein